MKHSRNGFSLLELVVSFALILIILTLGVPSLHAALIQNRVDSQMYNLSKDILLARNNAIQYEVQVVICHLDSSNDCDTNWSSGYSVFLDNNRDKAYQDSEDQILLVRDYTELNDILMFSGASNLTYGADGLLNSISGTFKYCPKVDNEEDYARALVVSLSGRPRISHDLDGDGKDEINDKDDHVSCTD